MAYAALVSLEHTTDLLLDPEKYSIPDAVNEEIRSIRGYVMALTSFLDDFPAKTSRLEAKIRELANDTEAIIEDFMRMQHRKQHWNLISDLLPQFRKRAEAIGSLFGEVMDGRSVGNSASSVSSARAAITRQKDVTVDLDDDLFTIKDRLCGESSKLQVVSIVGMGGIGKTTLARNAYDDPLIAYHFHIRAWVTVSQDYSTRNILSTLIDSMRFFIDEHVLEQKIDEAMVVYQTLKGRRYLIVMDDVWSTNVWDDLRNIFPDDGNGSRIILTTRISDLGAYPDSHNPLHMMRLMDDHQSWDLLQQRVGSIPSELEDVGKRISRRCAGLPLAVVLVAGVLSQGDMTPASWEEIATTGNPVVELELGAILSLSYMHLPHHLRPCLLFIGGLPADISIRASNIIRLWVAESFVKDRERSGPKSLEEVAEEYLDDLVKRNLVIVKSRKGGGKIKRCSVHDMVRDLCMRKASEERFIRVLDGPVHPQGLMSDQRIILSGGGDISNIWGPTIRTILCFELHNFHSWVAFLGRSRFLRVLDGVSQDSDDEELPAQVISELFHLRYLALYNYPKTPSSICNLVNLQTLIIYPCVKSRKIGSKPDFSLPLEVWRMRQLRHLILCVPHVLPPPQNPNGAKFPLENLQTLWTVRFPLQDENIIQMIPNVKKLGLVCMHEDHDLFHFKYLHQLEKLKVVGYSWQGKNLSFPRTLKKLSLVGARFPWKDMAIIGSLPNLQVLKLNDACDGETWETTCEEFPQLQSLLIENCFLGEWIIESNSFPKLRLLVLRSCWNLNNIPEDIGEIPSLELVEVLYCRVSLAESAWKIKEDQESYGNGSFQVRVVTYTEEDEFRRNLKGLQPHNPWKF